MDALVGTALAVGSHLNPQGQTAWAMLVLMVWPIATAAGALWASSAWTGQDHGQGFVGKCLCLGMLAASLPLLALLGTAVLV